MKKISKSKPPFAQTQPASAPSPVPPDVRDVPLNEKISERAYALWQKYGEPDNRSLEIWLEAERQLLGSDRQVNHQESGSVSAPQLGETLKPSSSATSKSAAANKNQIATN